MNKLMERMKKAGSTPMAEVLSDSAFFSVKDMIQTSIPALNIALSGKLDGGLTPGVTILAGPSRHFKSMLGLIMVKAYLDKYNDAICIFVDSEFGITPDYIRTIGIDTERVLHVPVEHIEQLKFDLTKRLDELKRGDKVIVFIDSIGNIASKKEAEDALNEKSAADMTRAKMLKSLFRIITPHFTTKDIPCVAVNHVYQEQSLFPKTIMSGGCLDKDTFIQTPKGLVQITEISKDDYVTTMDGVRRVSESWTPETLLEGYPECIEIEFADGYSVVCSENHQFLIDNEWVMAKDLCVGDDVAAI